MKPRILITGAARGLGLKIARLLHEKFDLVLSSRQNPQDFLLSMEKEGLSYKEYHQLDFARNPLDFLTALPKIKDISVIIHNASPYLNGSFFETKSTDIIEFGNFATNATQLVRNVDYAAQAKIVLIGSAAGDPNYRGDVGAAIYQIYKSYIQTLARVLIKENRVVTVINPGTINDAGQPNSVPSAAVLAAIGDAVFTAGSDNRVVSVYPGGTTVGL